MEVATSGKEEGRWREGRVWRRSDGMLLYGAVLAHRSTVIRSEGDRNGCIRARKILCVR